MKSKWFFIWGSLMLLLSIWMYWTLKQPNMRDQGQNLIPMVGGVFGVAVGLLLKGIYVKYKKP